MFIRTAIFALFFYLSVVPAFANTKPYVGSISPSSGVSKPGQIVNFTTTYNDTDGWKNILYGLFLINTSVNRSKCFYGYYNQNTNKLYLRNNDNTAWLGGYAPGSSYTIQNSYVKLNCAKTVRSGSGSTLAIRWNITFKSTFQGIKNSYLYVKDDVGAYSGWVKRGTWIIDGKPPTGTIKINNDSAYTNSAIVTLNLSAQDNFGGSGISQMQFSNNATTWSAPEAYAAAKLWVLISGDGTKTVYVKFKDKVGNWSPAYSDTIILDTTPPQLNITSPLGNEVVWPR